MTETSTASPGPGTVDPYADALGFGYAELAALLAMRPGPASTESAAALRITDEASDGEVIRAGASSLVAHGLATVGDERELVVGGAVAAVLSALSEAERRVDVGLLVPGGPGDSVLQVESSGFSILLQPRSYFCWFAMAQAPSLTGAEALLAMISSHLDTTPDGGASVYRRETPGKGRLLVRRDTGSWTIGYKFEGDDVIDRRTGLDDHALLAELADIRGE
jgi:hypothetical protein